MYKRILVPLDGSPVSRRGLQEALRLARQNKARVQLLHVFGMFIGTPVLMRKRPVDDIPDLLHAAGAAILKKAAALARERRVAVDTALLNYAQGRAAGAIVGQAKKWRADLIVIGTHGRRGFDRLALGSDAEIVVRTSPVPVLVVGPGKSSRR
jgi:nucleotide-binding universal stress UspA family protein